MKNHRFAELWDSTVPTAAPCPRIDPEDIIYRVNTALDGLPSKGRRQARRKTRFAAALTAAAVALVGTTLAVAVRWDVLDVFFRGDTAPAEALVDRAVRSTSDKDYTLTVDGSVSDGSTAYLVVKVEALHSGSTNRLQSDTFFDGDTFQISPVSDKEAPVAGENEHDTPVDISISCLLSIEEIEAAATETSRTWKVFFHLESDAVTGLQVHLTQMDEACVLTVPLTPADSVTVNIDATGPGGTDGLQSTQGRIAVDSVTLSPFTCRISVRTAEDGEYREPHLSILFADGTLAPLTQSVDSLCAYTYWEDGTGSYLYRLQSVLDLSTLSAVVFDGMAYPLDGGAPYPYAP